MKSLSKFWYMFLMLGFVVGLINPRIGIISAFNFYELFFMGILILISFVIRNIKTEGFRKSFLFTLMKGIMNVFSYVIPIFLFITIIIAEGAFYCISITNGTMFSPIKIFADNNLLCHILLALTVIINILSLLACIGRLKSIDFDK